MFSPAFLSIHLLNKRTEILHFFIEIEKHTVNMLSITCVFQANELIKGAKLITRQMFNCLACLNFCIRLLFVW